MALEYFVFVEDIGRDRDRTGYADVEILKG